MGAAPHKVVNPQQSREDPTLSPALASTQILDLDDQTQLADPSQLEAMLGEVTVVADHYPDDSKVQTAIEDIRSKITLRITATRKSGLPRA